jgi:hypothetical protein
LRYAAAAPALACCALFGAPARGARRAQARAARWDVPCTAPLQRRGAAGRARWLARARGAAPF